MEAQNVRVVEFSPDQDTDPRESERIWSMNDWDRVRQQGLEDMKYALDQAHKMLEAADAWAQTLAVVPAHLKPLVTDLHRKVARVMIEVKDLK